MHNNASFLTLLEHRCVIARLREELREALVEFCASPTAYITSAIRGDASGNRRKMLLRVGLAVGVLFYAIAFISMLVFWSVSHQRQATSNGELPPTWVSINGYYPKAEMPEGDDKPGGGGGGGREKQDAASSGDVPQFLVQPIVGPRPELQPKPPILPMIEAVMGDPRIQLKRDDLGVTGLPDGINGLPSAGSGTGGGIGTGVDGGIGSGNGPGVGPGHGGNIGEDGNGSGGRPRSSFQQPAVDSRPILLNQPHPLFTEEARKNKVQGVVRVRVLVDASGEVREVLIVRGLPDGLNEQAIRAAHLMRFRPAIRDGRPVSYWLSNVEIEFNLR
jgi:periplasmic protein TonB